MMMMVMMMKDSGLQCIATKVCPGGLSDICPVHPLNP